MFGTVERLDWAVAELAARDIPLHTGPDTPADLVEAAHRHDLHVMVLDSYELDPAGAGALRAAGVCTLAVVDGDSRGQDADLYLDQNYGARHPRLPGRLLAGSAYALLRDSVRTARPPTPPPATTVGRPRVLAFFGGTDAVGAAPVLTRVLVATGHPIDLTVVVGRPETEAELDEITPGRGQTIRPVPPTGALPSLITEADLVVSAAGTSTWELCCLGAPAALVCVVDNQRESYHQVVRHGLAAGLGELPELTATGIAGRAARATAARTLNGLLSSPQRRAALAARAWSAVDGRGRARVVDAVLAAVPTTTPTD